MAHPTLLALLERIRDDAADAAAIAAARELLEALPELEFDVTTLFVEGAAEDAEALLGVLGEQPAGFGGLLARALEAEGGSPGLGAAPVLEGVMRSLAEPEAVDELAAALSDEAGVIDEIAAGLDEVALPLAQAVAESAGAPPDVAAAFEEVELPIAEAVEQAAGRAPDVASTFDPAVVDLAGAVAVEAGRVEAVGPVFITLGLPDELPLADAVRGFAGPVDVADRVMLALGLAGAAPVARPASAVVHEPSPEPLPEGWIAGLLDHELPEHLHLRAAEHVVRDEAGAAELTAFAEVGRALREGVEVGAGPAPSLWAGVASAIGLEDAEAVPGWEPELLRAAFREEAGTVSVADAVLATVLSERQALVTDLEPLPEPANNVSWVAVSGLLAAAVMLLVLVPRLFAAPSDDVFVPVAPEFAAAGEVNVDRLTYGDNASVYVEVPTDVGTPLIIWVDDGAAR